MHFIKKHFSNIFFVLLIAIIFFNPFGLGMKIKSTIIKIISFSPRVIKATEREVLKNYNWKLVDVQGNVIDFNNNREKVVLINKWATWCPPCVAEMPSIQKLYNNYNDKIEFLIIANDTPEKVNQFMQKNGYTFPIYYEQTETLKEFESNSIPVTFLLDKNGAIVISKKGAADWNSTKTRKTIDALL